MHMYQVWAKDRHNHSEVCTILSTRGKPESEWKTAQEAFEAAKRLVHDKNRNNPMTFDDQKRDAEMCLMEVGAQDAFYIGNLIMGRHKIVVASQQTDPEQPPVESEAVLGADVPVRFYMGQD